MRRFKKMTAAVMAVATLATSMVPFSADAFSVDKNSKFTYDLKVEGTADNLIKVTFYTTCNPGVSGLSVAVRYDQDNLEFVKKSMDPDYDYITAKKTIDNPDDGFVITASATNTGSDYEGQVYFSYYFRVKNESEKQTYDFSSCVFSLQSKNENIDINQNFENSEAYPDKTVISKETYTRRIGDVIPSNLVDMNDVVELLGITSFLNSCTSDAAIYTKVLNSMLTADYSYTLNDGKTGTYRDRLKNSLYVDGVPFAEVADCDQNGKIEKADADLLITYYAQAAANQNPDSLINSELSKVVYADITM